MKRKFIYTPIFLGLFIISLSVSMQCYTSFNHPTVYVEADSAGYYYEQEVTFYDDCSSCHEQETPYVESSSDIYNDPVYNESYNWNYFFMTPWWFDEYYYYNEMPNQNDNYLEPPRKRDFGRRSDSADSPRYGTPSPSSPVMAKPKSDDANRSSSPPRKRPSRRQDISREDLKPKTNPAPAPKNENQSNESQPAKKKKK